MGRLRGVVVIASPFDYRESIEDGAGYAEGTCLAFALRAVNIWIISTRSVALWMTERSHSLDSSKSGEELDDKRMLTPVKMTIMNKRETEPVIT